jgi:DNA-binding LytR/AlgR family response regulator
MASAGNLIHQQKRPDGLSGDARRNFTCGGATVQQERTAEGMELLPSFRHGLAHDSLDLRAQSPTNQSYSLNRSHRIAIKADRRIILVDPAEISAVEAQGNYVILRQRNTSFMVRESLAGVAQQLEPYGFLRIHRSSVVNGASVMEIRALSTGEYALRVKDGRQYLVSRSYKKNLRLLADLWLGLSMIQ